MHAWALFLSRPTYDPIYKFVYIRLKSANPRRRTHDNKSFNPPRPKKLKYEKFVIGSAAEPARPEALAETTGSERDLNKNLFWFKLYLKLKGYNGSPVALRLPIGRRKR